MINPIGPSIACIIYEFSIVVTSISITIFAVQIAQPIKVKSFFDLISGLYSLFLSTLRLHCSLLLILIL